MAAAEAGEGKQAGREEEGTGAVVRADEAG